MAQFSTPLAGADQLLYEELSILNGALQAHPLGLPRSWQRRGYGLVHARSAIMALWSGEVRKGGERLGSALRVAPDLARDRRLLHLLGSTAPNQIAAGSGLQGRAVLHALEALLPSAGLDPAQRTWLYARLLLRLCLRSLRTGEFDRVTWFWFSALDRLPDRRARALALREVVMDLFDDSILPLRH